MLFLGALCPSKSGLMNKHIVKHIVSSISKGIESVMNKHIVKHSDLRYRFCLEGVLGGGSS